MVKSAFRLNPQSTPKVNFECFIHFGIQNFYVSVRFYAFVRRLTLKQTSYVHLQVNKTIIWNTTRRFYLRLEVDPMLECLLVVQRDPQIVPIINEVVLCFSGHFRSGFYSTRSEEVKRSTETDPGWLTNSNPRGTQRETNSDPFTECFSSRRSVPTLLRDNTSFIRGKCSNGLPHRC